MKGEIRWEALLITPKCLIQCFCADAVEFREIGIEHYPFAANEEHELNDILGLEDSRARVQRAIKKYESREWEKR